MIRLFYDLVRKIDFPVLYGPGDTIGRLGTCDILLFKTQRGENHPQSAFMMILFCPESRNRWKQFSLPSKFLMEYKSPLSQNGKPVWEHISERERKAKILSLLRRFRGWASVKWKGLELKWGGDWNEIQIQEAKEIWKQLRLQMRSWANLEEGGRGTRIRNLIAPQSQYFKVSDLQRLE